MQLIIFSMVVSVSILTAVPVFAEDYGGPIAPPADRIKAMKSPGGDQCSLKRGASSSKRVRFPANALMAYRARGEFTKLCRENKEFKSMFSIKKKERDFKGVLKPNGYRSMFAALFGARFVNALEADPSSSIMAPYMPYLMGGITLGLVSGITYNIISSVKSGRKVRKATVEWALSKELEIGPNMKLFYGSDFDPGNSQKYQKQDTIIQLEQLIKQIKSEI